MLEKPFAIVTASDAHCGDYLARHWLRSLQDHVDLSRIDVVVLDYGLDERQRDELRECGVRLVPAIKDGFIGNLRFRDLVGLLDATPYVRLLLCDAGDIIFQADVSHLLTSGDGRLGAVAEQFHTPFYDTMVDYDDMRKPLLREIVEAVCDRPILNVGVVRGSADDFRAIWAEYQRCCHGQQCYGSDQLVFNYFAYRHGFQELDAGYNFVLLTATRAYHIQDGAFCDDAGQLIPIVHNAGGHAFLRVVNDFGYGPDCNQPKPWRSALLRLTIYFARAWYAVRRQFSGHHSALAGLS